MGKGRLKLIFKLAKWSVWGGVIFFLAQALRANWQDIATIRISAAGWACILTATGVTLFAHIWSGWVWGWILATLNYPQGQGTWAIITYLKTNIAKYLPGNVWHFVGRVLAAKAIAIPMEASTVSVIIEALLMAAAALLVGLLSSQQLNLPLQLICLFVGLVGVHPRVLNPILKRLKVSKLKTIKQDEKSEGRRQKAEGRRQKAGGKRQKAEGRRQKAGGKRQKAEGRRQKGGDRERNSDTQLPIPDDQHSTADAQPLSSDCRLLTPNFQLQHYPLLPLLGELGFLILRSMGFVIVVIALTPLSWSDYGALLSGFSLAWMLGLVVPGAPGGIGVFEATAIALLGQSTSLSDGVIVGAVALYRLVSTLAEAIGAFVAWLDERH